MKHSFALCALALVVAPLTASAAPKRKPMGPSAIEAARLEKYPPRNYLSHYLPDDRYKIAGGVWKFVSTDLDTYYHVPSSPNMLRQPADRVIGFASVKDAEEAGYVADPTDGTANASRSSFSIGALGQGLTSVERRYLTQVLALGKYAAQAKTVFDQVNAKAQLGVRQGTQGGNLATMLNGMKPLMPKYVATYRSALNDLNRLTPPPRLRTFHALTRSAAVNGLNSAILASRGISQGSLGTLVKSIEYQQRMISYDQKAAQELKRVSR